MMAPSGRLDRQELCFRESNSVAPSNQTCSAAGRHWALSGNVGPQFAAPCLDLVAKRIIPVSAMSHDILAPGRSAERVGRLSLSAHVVVNGHTAGARCDAHCSFVSQKSGGEVHELSGGLAALPGECVKLALARLRRLTSIEKGASAYLAIGVVELELRKTRRPSRNVRLPRHPEREYRLCRHSPQRGAHRGLHRNAFSTTVPAYS